MESTQRKKLSKSEAYSLIESYFSSGELPSVFYRRVGLSDNQFYGWRKKYLRDHPILANKLGISIDGKTPRNASYRLSQESTHRTSSPEDSAIGKGFACVEVSDSCSSTTSTIVSSPFAPAYELCYPNGVVLRLPAGIAVSSLSELIRLY